MWKRSQLKTNAKVSLGRGIFKSRWLMGLLAAFLGLLLAGGFFTAVLPTVISQTNINVNLAAQPAVNMTEQSTVRKVTADDYDELQQLLEQLQDQYSEYYNTDDYNTDNYGIDEYNTDDGYSVPDDYYDNYFKEFGEDDLGDYGFFSDGEYGSTISSLGSNWWKVVLVVAAVYLLIALVVGLISLIYSIFVGNVVEAGMARYFLANRNIAVKETPSIGLLFSNFKKGQYGSTIKSMLWRDLFIFLWGLIPIVGPVFAIIKRYSYHFVPQIMADNPKTGFKEALNMSKEMTKGNKGKMFVLDLSFIGWFIVGALCLGIGTLWVNPYYYATYAELYDVLKKTSVANGKYAPEAFSMNRNGLVLNMPYISNPYYDKDDSAYVNSQYASQPAPKAQQYSAPTARPAAPVGQPAAQQTYAAPAAQQTAPVYAQPVYTEPAPVQPEYADEQTDDRPFDMPDPAAFAAVGQPAEAQQQEFAAPIEQPVQPEFVAPVEQPAAQPETEEQPASEPRYVPASESEYILEEDPEYIALVKLAEQTKHPDLVRAVEQTKQTAPEQPAPVQQASPAPQNQPNSFIPMEVDTDYSRR